MRTKSTGIPGTLIGPRSSGSLPIWRLGNSPQKLFWQTIAHDIFWKLPSIFLYGLEPDRVADFCFLGASVQFVSPFSSSISCTMSSNVSSAGITTDATTGERYIPSSVRADGSKRREIRVRPGYKPPEDVELYRNRAAAAWKNRGKGGVPGADAVSSEDDKAAQAASNKNAKRREARRKAKEADGSEPAPEKKGADSDNWRVPAAKKEEKPAEEPVDLEAEKEKKARNLKKKLRQARDLRDKKNEGEVLLPEQLEKLIKIPELIRQLDALGFDANCDKKENASPEKA